MARSPWDNYILPQPLLFVNSFLRFFLFFFKKSCISCAPMVTRFLVPFPYTLYILYRSSKDLSLSPLSIYIIQYHLDQCQEFLCKLTGKFTGREFSSDPGQRKITSHVFVHYDGKFYVLHKSGLGFSVLSFSPKIRDLFCAIRRNPFFPAWVLFIAAL